MEAELKTQPIMTLSAPPAPSVGAPPLTGTGYYPAYVLRRHGGAWEVVVVRVPGEVLDDPEFVMQRREPTRLANALAWVAETVGREAQR